LDRNYLKEKTDFLIGRITENEILQIFNLQLTVLSGLLENNIISPSWLCS